MDIRRDEISPLFVAQELHKIPQWAKAEHLERYISLKELWEYPEGDSKKETGWWIEIYHPIEMGEEYRYVISDEEEGFRIWREQDPVKLDLTLNEQHQLVDFEANSD